jgi:hypothetical protein
MTHGFENGIKGRVRILYIVPHVSGATEYEESFLHTLSASADFVPFFRMRPGNQLLYLGLDKPRGE